ncbi:Sensor protein fixL [Minicystis rosea]|nr:Sensor protein fixL [Minicystis rosea]
MAVMSVPDVGSPVSALTATAPVSTLPPASAPPRPSSPPSDPGRDLAGALHEVSNALTVVLGWLERARDERGGPELARALDVAMSRAAQARGIVRRAIGADVPAEAPRSHAEETVGHVVADALTGLEPELRRAGLEAHVIVASDVEARRLPHAPSVLQILTNLLLNAAALSPHGATVRLEAEPAGERVLFAVTDAGPGVPPDRRETLFHAGVSTRAGGAGIGLRHAAALARSYGGELSLADSDTGARFELTWPLDALEVEETAAPEDATVPATQRVPADLPRVAARLAGTRILLVEDDDAVIDLLDTALTARGADVVSVRRRSELDRALGSGRFDAALFDISPIQDDVSGAVARARDASDALRVVMISGTAVSLPSLPEGWIAAWVRKPFEIGEIVDAIAPAARG